MHIMVVLRVSGCVSCSMQHFVGYDPEGYSMWACDFKYNEENTVNFVVMNKVGGFLQRCDLHSLLP